MNAHNNKLGAAISFPLVAAPTITCPDCHGSGESMYLALDSTRYEPGYCEPCGGTGEVEASCCVCEGKLDASNLCPDCDYPSGWLLAERSAVGMAVRHG